MSKKMIVLLPVLLLTACISVAVEAPPTAVYGGFVTATLPPTKPAYVPLTLTPTAAVTLTPQVEVTIPADCKDGAVLLRDVTIPDGTKMKAGEAFTKTWEFRNTGTCPWVNYVLKFAAGEKMNAPLSAPIPLVMPGDTVEVSVDLVAPVTAGAYDAYFTINNTDGNDLIVGVEKTFWLKIVVGE